MLTEIAKQLGWADEQCTLRHYRTKDGVEVDAILEHADGRVVGIEVKAAATVRSEDLRHLVHLRQRLGDRFHAGVVVHLGPTSASFGDRLWAVPLSALWTTAT